MRIATALVSLAVLAGSACGGGTSTTDTSTSEPPPTSTTSAGEPVTHSTSVPPLHPSIDGYDEATVELVTATTVHRLAVKVAATQGERAHGLMEVTELPDGTGMLFVYDDDRTGGFWMKDTLVPLDIAFAAADGTIVSILAMDPCTVDPCPTYTPDAPYRSALEVPQGWFARMGVTEGDVLRTLS
jgi:uncharacterized membrane protein (UPF0127 family)